MFVNFIIIDCEIFGIMIEYMRRGLFMSAHR